MAFAASADPRPTTKVEAVAAGRRDNETRGLARWENL